MCIGWRRFLLFVPLIFFYPHILSVLELHQNSTAKDLHQKNPKKFDHLILGPAAGEGLHDRLQCQGIKALNKTHSASSDKSSVGGSVAVVTVFTTYNSSVDKQATDMSRVTVGKVSYNKVERSMAILNIFINFIQVTMPQSNIIILTDPASELSVHRNRVTVYPIQGVFRSKA